MSKKKSQNKSNKIEAVVQPKQEKSKRNFVLALIGVAIFLALGFWFFRGVLNNKTKSRPVGSVIGCQQYPKFMDELGFRENAALSTSDRRISGIILTDGKRKYQHPSWKSAGRLAPIQRDRGGNIFVAPAPSINVLENKPEDQNKIYKIDGRTQEMKQFVDLPKTAEPISENPYGVIGLAFDCDTDSLYASTVSGSTRKNINGRIFQVDTKTSKPVSSLDGIDAGGLAVYNTPKGKRLYFGLTRTSDIWSVDLNDDGSFAGQPKFEFTIEGFGPRGDDKARRIVFDNNEMRIHGVEFNFNLIAPSEKQETIYKFRYDSARDSWVNFQDVPQN